MEGATDNTQVRLQAERSRTEADISNNLHGKIPEKSGGNRWAMVLYVGKMLCPAIFEFSVQWQ
jgi:hypothetical protein